jgi:hypothetical protein
MEGERFALPAASEMPDRQMRESCCQTGNGLSTGHPWQGFNAALPSLPANSKIGLPFLRHFPWPIAVKRVLLILKPRF